MEDFRTLTRDDFTDEQWQKALKLMRQSEAEESDGEAAPQGLCCSCFGQIDDVDPGFYCAVCDAFFHLWCQEWVAAGTAKGMWKMCDGHPHNNEEGVILGALRKCLSDEPCDIPTFLSRNPRDEEALFCSLFENRKGAFDEAQLRRGILDALDEEKDSVPDSLPCQLLDRHGRFFTPSPLPACVPKMPKNSCYFSAAAVVQESDPNNSIRRMRTEVGYQFAFGVACSPSGGAMEHAWCVTESGTVVDPIWRNPENCAYFGVPLSLDLIEAYFPGMLNTRQFIYQLAEPEELWESVIEIPGELRAEFESGQSESEESAVISPLTRGWGSGSHLFSY